MVIIPENDLITIFSILLFLFCLIQILKAKIHNKKLPPQPKGAWPIIGHLRLLAGNHQRHETLGELADKYGPIYMLKIGVYKSLIISSPELAKECFTTNDKIFADRPKILVGEVLGYNSGMLGFSPYGTYWRQMRKIATLELLSNHRLQMVSHIRESEIRAAINGVVAAEVPVVKMKQWFGDIILNVIFRIIVGKRFGNRVSEEDENGGSEKWREAVMKWFVLAGKGVVCDAMPFLRFLDLGGHEKNMKKTAMELDVIVQGWLDEHKEKRKSVKGDEDFMDAMVSILEDEKELPTQDADTINKAMCLGFIIAASDTTKFTLIWALALMLKNPNTLKKAQQELDTNVGSERHVQESDMNNLVYLQAILKETLRLNPPAALSVPHESMEECTVGGYFIPKGTRLMVNLWKMQRDPRIWEEPCEFRPERFLTTHKHVDVRGHNFELLPFGSGRRMCPGVSFSLQVMQLTLANLIHAFDISIPPGEQIDLDGAFRINNQENTEIKVLLNPRLPAHLYQ
ncbi:cytochrome P450 CYP82D47-like [Euphorbia lathyris]|uniref:cytochrome P450 CYP82D47-like n=1 Tax=Euphorbia lathyris TaxID=212925 RepID=UPI00331324A0